MPAPHALLAALSASLAAGCLGAGLHRTARPDDAPPTRFPQCLGTREEVDPARLAEGEFPTAPAPGVTVYEEVPVSDKGCIRAYQQLVDGKLVGQGLVMALGAVERFTTPDGRAAFRESERFLSREVRTDSSSRTEVDGDGDGFLERAEVQRWDEAGLLEEVVSHFDPRTGAVLERRCRRRASADAGVCCPHP